MTTVIARLMQESGVQGPTETFTLEHPDPPRVELRRMVREWADGQIGHPWDSLTMEWNDRVEELYEQPE